MKKILTSFLAGLMVLSTLSIAQAQAGAGERHIDEIRTALLRLPYYGVFDNLAYKVDGYKVTLLGQVTRPTLKSDAERVVKDIEGVEQVVNNIEVKSESDPDRIRAALYEQAFGPVRWVECVREIKSRGVETVIECGPGRVLAGLVKRIDGELASAAVYDPASLAEAKALLG